MGNETDRERVPNQEKKGEQYMRTILKKTTQLKKATSKLWR
jgi:hypothetical protein